MDPQTKSLVTTILAALAAAAGGAAATHGYITADQQSAFRDIVVSIVTAGATGLIAWYKQRTASPKALIEAVNAGDNGVKVVSATATAQVVNGPLKEASK